MFDSCYSPFSEFQHFEFHRRRCSYPRSDISSNQSMSSDFRNILLAGNHHNPSSGEVLQLTLTVLFLKFSEDNLLDLRSTSTFDTTPSLVSSAGLFVFCLSSPFTALIHGSVCYFSTTMNSTSTLTQLGIVMKVRQTLLWNDACLHPISISYNEGYKDLFDATLMLWTHLCFILKNRIEMGANQSPTNIEILRQYR